MEDATICSFEWWMITLASGVLVSILGSFCSEYLKRLISLFSVKMRRRRELEKSEIIRLSDDASESVQTEIIQRLRVIDQRTHVLFGLIYTSFGFGTSIWAQSVKAEGILLLYFRFLGLVSVVCALVGMAAVLRQSARTYREERILDMTIKKRSQSTADQVTKLR